MIVFNILALLLLLISQSQGGCVDGGSGGCSPPTGSKWDTWSMRESTYTYCYGGCVVDWLMDHTDELNLPLFAGVVGVDHYWTRQGVPVKKTNIYLSHLSVICITLIIFLIPVTFT